ncbi:hypothetical protein LOZ51_006745 [Ophidiomyces ophidiicola]|nr:hypothetical protein LOZ55_006133 [Ophidiomyces ophidiicola]KAI1984060.1 hypothetical protein LOZ51_006745 [Ophidiomyces ophidiicola]
MCRWNEAGNLGMATVEISNPSRLGGVLEYNTRDGRMEVGYLIHPDLWGRGYATEALKAAIQAWWEGYEADRPPEGMADELYAVTHTGNVPSYRVLTKCGFEKTEDFQDEHGPGEPQHAGTDTHGSRAAAVLSTAVRSMPEPSPQLIPDQPPAQSQSPRLNNSTKLLIGGSIFFALSALITRRSLSRRRIASIPPYYTSATNHKPPVNGAMEALEALNIASINVVSLAMLGVGGAMHAFEINTLDDLRRKVRGGLGADGSGRSEQQVEEELEEWVVTVLNRKAEKEKTGQRTGDQGATNERGKER